MCALRLPGGCVYGPVASRRLGASLGVNLLPWRYKVCSFDCIYCHYGETQLCTLSRDDWGWVPLYPAKSMSCSA